MNSQDPATKSQIKQFAAIGGDEFLITDFLRHAYQDQELDYYANNETAVGTFGAVTWKWLNMI